MEISLRDVDMMCMDLMTEFRARIKYLEAGGRSQDELSNLLSNFQHVSDIKTWVEATMQVSAGVVDYLRTLVRWFLRN